MVQVHAGIIRYEVVSLCGTRMGFDGLCEFFVQL